MAVVTDGDFSTEDEGLEIVDRYLNAGNGKSFRLYKEVEGFLLRPRFGVHSTKVRCDRLLVPLKPMIDAGWKNGALFLEAKKPGVTIGKPICQCIDYLQSVYRLPDSHITVMPEYGFIWHMVNYESFEQSVLVNHRVGFAYHAKSRDELRLAMSSTVLIQIHGDGRVTVRHQPFCGNKAGSH